MAEAKTKKPVDPGVEFIKFLKDIYRDETQFNIGDGFSICSVANNYAGIDASIWINPPKGQEHSYSIKGSIDLSGAPGFRSFIESGDSIVMFDNKDIDELRKTKISAFGETKITSDEFIITTNSDDGTSKQYAFKKTAFLPKAPLYDAMAPHATVIDAQYRMEIPPEKLDEPSLRIYTSKSNPKALTFSKDDAASTIIDIPTKSIVVKMKKDAHYLIEIYPKETGYESQLVFFHAVSKTLRLMQIFRVIEF